jgi:DNA-binding response OmpR family regulator
MRVLARRSGNTQSTIEPLAGHIVSLANKATSNSRGTNLGSPMIAQATRSEAEPSYCLIVRSREYDQRLLLSSVIEAGFLPVEVAPQSWRAVYSSLKPVITIAVVDASTALGLGELTELSEELPRGSLLAVVPRAEQVPYVVAAGSAEFLSDEILTAALPAQLLAMRRKLNLDFPLASSEDEIELAEGVGIDARSRRLTGPEGTVSLSPFEMSLLSQLAAHRGYTVTPLELLSTAKGREASAADAARTVKTYIRRIRKKFEEVGANPRLIATVRNAGYMLELPAS